MKTLVLMLVSVAMSSLLIAQHVPTCQGNNHQAGYTVCWAYAQGRAFGSSWNHPVCPVSTLYHTNRINTDYFYVVSTSLNVVQEKDILEFGNGEHYSYVKSVGPNKSYDDIIVDQVDGENTGVEQTNLELWKVRDGYGTINERGPVTHVLRMKSVWPIKVENEFAEGDIQVAGNTTTSPYEQSHQWKQALQAVAVMDGEVVGAYRKIFDKWKKDGGTFSSSKSEMVWPDGYNLSSPTVYTATFTNYFDVTFDISSQGGTIKVGGTTRSVPYTTMVRADAPSVQVEAVDASGSWCDYVFSKWTNDKNSNIDYSRNTTLQVSSNNTTFTANFNAKPFAATNVTAGGPVDESPTITWTDNPNSAVTYQIWRRLCPRIGQPLSDERRFCCERCWFVC